MSRSATGPPPGCREIAERLPWFANGSLASAERRVIELHLDGCAACGAELERCEAERTALRSEPRAAPSPHPAQLGRLFERIDAGATDAIEPDRDEASAPPWAGSALLRRTPRPVRWILAAQLVTVLGLGLVVAQRETAPAAPFRTLSTAAVAPAAAALRVVFAAEATEAEMRAILLAAGVEIVSGPTPVGAYSIALRAGVERAVALAALRSDPRVRFAEPTVSGPELDAPTP